MTIPSVGDARLHIVAQNAENYLMNLEASNSSCATEEEFEEKTDKMANVFIALQADIVAICEVEANDEVLGYIVNAMNTIYGQSVYTYLHDVIDEPNSGTAYQKLKVGFIYRTDKVEPTGSIVSPYRSGEYYRRLRIQAFKEKNTNEAFILSMNHFKAKDDGAETRLENAANLIDKLADITYDADILIMGDLNADTDEQSVQNLINAGYEEQLERFDPYAYTYKYKGDKVILDHAMANETMAEQVTGAYAYHINTYNYYSDYHYSDHDAVLVGLKLGKDSGEGLEDTGDGQTAVKKIVNGQLVIERNGITYTLQGMVINN